MKAREILCDFDRYLGACGHSFEGLVVGRSALELLGLQVPSWSSQEPAVEVVYPRVPELVVEAAETFGLARALSPRWLRDCTADVLDQLPHGWHQRLRLMTFTGRAIYLHSLARPDIIASRLLGLAEGRLRVEDCLALGVLPGDLERAREYLMEQHVETAWQRHVERTLADLTYVLHRDQPGRHLLDGLDGLLAEVSTPLG